MPVAVITGSSSGIGLAIARRFAEDGFDIVLHGNRNLAGLQAAASEIGGATRCITADLSQVTACRNLVDTCYRWHSHIDVWVSNAGADVISSDLARQSFDQRLQALLDVDVRGTICVGRRVAQRYAESRAGRPASLINVSWDQAWLGMEGDAGQLFCPTKAATAAFTRALAMSTESGLRVNCVAPGWIQTNWGEFNADDYWHTRATSESLSQRWGTPKDVAEAVFWLASPHSEFVNGQCLAINGGRRFYPQSMDQRNAREG